MKNVIFFSIMFVIGMANVWYMVTLANIEPYTVERDVQAMLWTPAGFVGVAWIVSVAGYIAYMTEKE